MKEILNDSKIKYYFLFIIILISFYRSPYIFLNGRFGGEEGSKYFAYVWENGFLEGLFYFENRAGYFNLIANVLVSTSSLIKIEFSPLITVYGSFIFILLPLYFILFRESVFFNTNLKKYIGSLLVFITPPLVPEVWVISISTQVYLCISSIIILFMVNLSNFQKKINFFIIFIAGFSGVYTCCLLPLFFINYYLKKNLYNFINFIILSFSTGTQLYFVLRGKINNQLNSNVLAADLDLDLMINYVYNILAKPILGRQITHFLWNDVILLIPGINYLYLFILIFLCLIIFMFNNYKNLYEIIIKNKVLAYLLYIFFIISILVLVGAAGDYVGGRYAVIPGVILLLILLHLSFELQGKKNKLFFIILISISLISGINEFRPPTKNVKNQYIRYLDCINCPDWKSEVKKWKNDNTYKIGIWPYPKKTMTLK
jgi:hypothetical protein